MISVAEALARVLALADLTGTETVALRHASGRVLAAPVTALRDQPPFAVSAMDGYALGADDALAGARATVVGEAGAGHGWAGRLTGGQALRIFTGAPVPAGADRVIAQEDVTRDGDVITLSATMDAAINIRSAAADFAAGAVLSAPRRLAPRDLALLGAMGTGALTLRKKPVVAFMATGDELVVPGEAAGPDQIFASNIYALQAMALAEGAEVRLLPIARDTADALRFAFALAEGADLIVTIGGASVGDHDLVAKVAADLGMDQAFYKVAMRPGKPLMAGRLGRSAMLGLPGNPVSAIVCGELFLRPMIRAMLGLPDPAPAPRRAVLAAGLGANGPRAHYMRASLSVRTLPQVQADLANRQAEGQRKAMQLPADDASLPGPDIADGLPRITAFERQDSALLSVLAQADALLIRPPGDGPHPPGTVVDYLPI